MYKLHTAQMSMTGNLRRKKKIERERERKTTIMLQNLLSIYLFMNHLRIRVS